MKSCSEVQVKAIGRIINSIEGHVQKFHGDLTIVLNAVNTTNWNPQTIRLSKQGFAPFNIPVYLQKRSVYLSAMNNAIIRFHEYGLADYVERSIEVPHLFKEADLKALSRDPKALWKETATQVSLSLNHHLNGAFWILVVGCGVGILTFLCEIILHRRSTS